MRKVVTSRVSYPKKWRFSAFCYRYPWRIDSFPFIRFVREEKFPYANFLRWKKKYFGFGFVADSQKESNFSDEQKNCVKTVGFYLPSASINTAGEGNVETFSGKSRPFFLKGQPGETFGLERWVWLGYIQAQKLKEPHICENAIYQREGQSNSKLQYVLW